MTFEAERPAGLSLSTLPLAFLAGALSVLIFQYGLSAALYAAGFLPGAPYSMAPTAPLGVPQTVSAAFWGGVWAIVLLPVLRTVGGGLGYWLVAALFGAVVVAGVLAFVVFPLKGRPFAAGWNIPLLGIIALLHAVFGLGSALFMRLFGIAGR